MWITNESQAGINAVVIVKRITKIRVTPKYFVAFLVGMANPRSPRHDFEKNGTIGNKIITVHRLSWGELIIDCSCSFGRAQHQLMIQLQH